jgi:tRNA (cytidine/uridine-2'-O-)-methyltransferase
MKELLTNPIANIAMIEPEIPQNIGNIGRTCVGTQSNLHLVGKMGFVITDAKLKRAGLDYWPHLSWTHHATYGAWEAQIANPKRVFYFSTKGKKSYFDQKFERGDWLVFGKETKGLDPAILEAHPEQVVTIPQFGPVRSLNVATAVAIALYELVRQVQPR